MTNLHSRYTDRIRGDELDAASVPSGRRRSLRRLPGAALAAGLAAATLAVAAPAAHAINPPQTAYSGVVNVLGGTASYSIRDFWTRTLPAWGYAYRTPTLKYYTTPVQTACGKALMNNSFWCSADWTIWLDYNWNQTQVNQYGDFGAGGILAHEWGHAVDSMTRTRAGNYKDEYHSDCLAGLYYRYGYAGGRLLAADYGEFYNWLYYRPSSPSHGYGPTRAAWFRYGYTQYSKAACDSVYRATAATAANPTVTSLTSDGIVGTSSGEPKVPGGGPAIVNLPPNGRTVQAGELPAGTAGVTLTEAPPAA